MDIANQQFIAQSTLLRCSSAKLYTAQKLSTLYLLALVFTALLSATPVLHAKSADTVVVVNDLQNESVIQFISKLKSQLANYRIHITNSTAVNRHSQNILFYITIGNTPLKRLIAKKTRAPILATLISEGSYRSIIHGRKHKNVTAIFSDPDLDYQLKLINNLYDKPVKVAVILSDKTKNKRKHILELARTNKLNIKIVNFNPGDNIYKVLNKISDAELLMAIPDDNVYNRESLRTIILTTYRRNQALIGYTGGMVKLGALATVAPDIEDLAKEINFWINKYKTHKTLPVARSSRTFSLIINEHVARSLNVRVTNAVMLAEAISEKMLSIWDTTSSVKE